MHTSVLTRKSDQPTRQRGITVSAPSLVTSHSDALSGCGVIVTSARDAECYPHIMDRCQRLMKPCDEIRCYFSKSWLLLLAYDDGNRGLRYLNEGRLCHLHSQFIIGFICISRCNDQVTVQTPVVDATRAEEITAVLMDGVQQSIHPRRVS